QFYFDRSEDAFRVLALVARHDALPVAAASSPARPAELPEAIGLGLPEGALTEGEVKRLLAAYGMAGAPEAIAGPPEAAAAAAGALGFPVALKAVSRRIAHKSEVGAVRLELGSAAEVATAAREMLAALGKAGLEGFSVQPMIRGGAELIVGARRD